MAILVLAGCGGLPEGVDRDLVGDWAAMPELERMVPEVGTCLDNEYKENVGLRLYDKPVDCSEPHQLETIHVGFFDEDEIVDKDEAPGPGTDLWRSAYQECDTADAAWALRISTIVQGMGPDDWDNGDRGFLCFLHVYDDQVDRPLEGAGVDALRSS